MHYSQLRSTLLMFQQGNARMSAKATRWCQGNPCRNSWQVGKPWGYINLLPTTLWEVKPHLPLLAFTAHRRNPSMTATWCDWEIICHLWGSRSYTEISAWCPVIIHKDRASWKAVCCPTHLHTTASGINISQPVFLYKIDSINKLGAIAFSLYFLYTISLSLAKQTN